MFRVPGSVFESQRQSFPRIRAGLIIVLCGVAIAWPALGDMVSMQNGDVLRGQLLGFDGSKLSLKTDYAGTIELPAKAIAGITTDDVVTVRFKDGGYFTGRLHSAVPGELRIIGEDPPSSARIALSSVAEIHPGKKVPRGLKWSGRVNFGASKRTGNTETEALHADGDVTGRAPKDRIKLRGEINRETDDGRTTEDDFRILVQHDHFVNGKLYFYTNAKLEKDKPADLKLRTTIGTGVGYQVYESARTNLSFEGGPSFANEDLVDSEDKEFLAARWAVDFDHKLWREYVQVFHRHEGTIDLEIVDDVFVTSSTGFRIPLGNGFNVTAQLDLDWDNKPAPGQDGTDKKYLLTVGYAW